MNWGVERYLQGVIERFPLKGDVLEVGSYDVNGSARKFFSDRERFPSYFGIDMREGPGVDRVATASDIPYVDKCYPIVVSTEMLEHDDRFWLSVQEFNRVLFPSGYLILTTRNVGYERHDYPNDYWRFTSDGLRSLLEWAGFEVLESIDHLETKGTFATAIKP